MNRYVSKAFRKLGYTIDKQNTVPAGLGDPLFAQLFERCKPHTMTTWERQFSLYKTTKYVVKNNIPGDYVECGVWKGGASMLVALTMLEEKDSSRNLYLYDTYAGMAEPGENDKTYGKSAINTWRQKQKDGINEWCYSPLEEVENNMRSTGYPADKIHLVKGKVEDTIPGVAPAEISILRLDTDWYSSTKHEMDELYHRVAKNGVVIIDDYSYWEGSKKAVEEYFAAHNIAPLLHRIDGTAVVFQKL